MLGGSTLTEVIGVRFKRVGKSYYFSPKKLKFLKGQFVIVETARGIEYGEVVMENREIEDESVVAPLKEVIRRASEEDHKKAEDNLKKEKEAFVTCGQMVEKHKLEMSLVDVELTFDNNKLLFYFTADGRIDFRDLVKDLASIFRTRIELRQIGVRDEAKMLGGLGICGLPFCCSTFLGEFNTVSIKMAKEQGLSLNPAKISGTCGRLMCCLNYEQAGYEELLKITPKVDAIVSTPMGKGTVINVDVLKGNLKVRIDGESIPKVFHKDEVKIIKDSVIKLEKAEIELLKKLEE